DEASVGRTVLWNLLSSPFGGTIYPVNPKRAQVLGIKSFPRVGDIPEPVDLAIIVTPASTVPGLVRECASAGIGAAIVISAGFQESGHADLEKQLAEESAGSGMRIVGPNCLGIMSPVTGLNATFASRMALRGNVA